MKHYPDNPMPLLYINLGAEMLYVLDQRLRSVGTDKASKVLTDLINNMFKAEKLQKYFMPSACNFTLEDLKLQFQDIATSSIMKLNATSMDKLFDLMVMTLKYQLQMLISPEHLITLTVNHLDGILAMFHDQDEISNSVQYAYKMVMSAYKKAHVTELYMLLSEMSTYFQNCRVKTSLLMRAGKQNDEGFFITSKDEHVITERTESPGFVRYYEDTVLTRTEEFRTNRPDKRIDLQKEDLRLQQQPRLTDLGANMYRKEQELMVKDDEPSAGEATFLSAIITRGGEGGLDNFDLSLFDSNADETQYAAQTAAAAAAVAASLNAVHIDASKTKKSLSSAISEMKTGGGTKKGKGADLLDMFDEAAARPPTGAKKRGGSLKAPKKSPASADGERPTTRKAAGRPSTEEGAPARPASKSATRPSSGARPASKGGAAAPPPRSRPASKEGARPASKAGAAARPGSGTAAGAPERARSASAKKRTPPA